MSGCGCASGYCKPRKTVAKTATKAKKPTKTSSCKTGCCGPKGCGARKGSTLSSRNCYDSDSSSSCYSDSSSDCSCSECISDSSESYDDSSDSCSCSSCCYSSSSDDNEVFLEKIRRRR